ncbi:MAG: hypothetical protein V4643_13600 [Bacteroidota bacterium]
MLKNNFHTKPLFKRLAVLTYSSLFAFIILANGSVKAENTYGYCNIKDKKGGTDIFTLFGNTAFNCVPVDQNWQQVLVKVLVLKQKVYDDQQILSQAKLFNENRKQIGLSLIDFTPYKFIAELDSYYVFELSGLMQQACINTNSIPELDVNKILSTAKQNAEFELFEKHLKAFNYTSVDSNGKYQSFVLNEYNFTKHTYSPRILIVFYKNELIAIFYSREIIAKLYDSIEMGSQYKLIYNSKFTENTKTEMMDIYKKQMLLN